MSQHGTCTPSNPEHVHLALWNIYMFHPKHPVSKRLIVLSLLAYALGIARLMPPFLCRGFILYLRCMLDKCASLGVNKLCKKGVYSLFIGIIFAFLKKKTNPMQRFR